MAVPGSTIVWFRKDLRLADNPALNAAVKRKAPIIPVYIFDEETENPWSEGAASRWWLHHSLASFRDSLEKRGSRLILLRGNTEIQLRALIHKTGATAIFWNDRYEPAIATRDRKLSVEISGLGVEVQKFNGALLHEPASISNKTGKPFQVFTPFWRHCLAREISFSESVCPARLVIPSSWPASVDLTSLELLPQIQWDAGFQDERTVGEAAAQRRLKSFLASSLANYADRRNLPGLDGTSRFSAHLHFGELSPKQIWTAVRDQSNETGVFPDSRSAQVFLTEIGWREFAYHLLYHFPETPDSPLRAEFGAFPWVQNQATFTAWRKGQTGYPIVDAGMRQLWSTGWMHNRVRMIVGSFLVKHLLISWQKGARWFWDTLVDADLANNTLGWQWSSGCGADAAPYFRIFNPVLQGQKFDASGEYVRKWVPELSKMPVVFLHSPWEADTETLRRAGVVLGVDYPNPIVNHQQARDAALAALKTIRKQERPT